MTFAEDLWLRGKAAQTSVMHMAAFNGAVAGTATIQAWKLGLNAPLGFWQALGRAGGLRAATSATPRTARAASGTATAAKAGPRPAAKAAASGPEAPAPKAAPAQTPDLATPARPGQATKPEAPTPATSRQTPKSTVPAALGPSPHLLDTPRGGKADDLTLLAGVGPKLAAALNEFGIYHFDQIATLDADGIAWLNDQQPGFKMIAARYKVVDQARDRLGT